MPTFRIYLLLLATLWLGAVSLAQADDTGCGAVITTVKGETMQVKQLAVRLMEDAFPGTQLVVFYDGGQSIMDLGRLRRLTRLSPLGEVAPGSKVEFAFQDDQGKTGKFKLMEGCIFSGQIDLGAWSERAANIKQIKITCPPPEPPAGLKPDL